MNAKINAKRIISLTTGLALVGSLLLAVPVFAETNNNANANGGGDNQGSKRESSVGTPRYGMMQGRGLGDVKFGTSTRRMMSGRVGADGKPWTASTSPRLAAVIGNGQPVVAGTVSTVSGNTLTVTTSSNVTYTVDATSAKIFQGQSTTTLSNVVVGDKVVVQGTVNGASVTATIVIDQKVSNGTPGSEGLALSNIKQGGGMFGGIGQFFMHLFGF